VPDKPALQNATVGPREKRAARCACDGIRDALPRAPTAEGELHRMNTDCTAYGSGCMLTAGSQARPGRHA
jgi:hypothetical protein